LSLSGLAAKCSEPTQATQKPLFEIEFDGLVGKFYKGAGFPGTPDVLEVYKDGQLLYRMSDSNGNQTIGDGVGITHNYDELTEFENGVEVGSYLNFRVNERGNYADIYGSMTKTDRALLDRKDQKLREATTLYQKFLKAGLSH